MSTRCCAQLLLLVVVMDAYKVTALLCYHCESSSNPKCGEPFDGKQVQPAQCLAEESSGFVPACLKEYHSAGDGTLLLRRSCVAVRPEDTSEPCTLTPADYYRTCSVCQTDRCNAAGRPLGLGLALAVWAAVARLLC